MSLSRAVAGEGFGGGAVVVDIVSEVSLSKGFREGAIGEGSGFKDNVTRDG